MYPEMAVRLGLGARNAWLAVGFTARYWAKPVGLRWRKSCRPVALGTRNALIWAAAVPSSDWTTWLPPLKAWTTAPGAPKTLLPVPVRVMRLPGVPSPVEPPAAAGAAYRVAPLPTNTWLNDPLRLRAEKALPATTPESNAVSGPAAAKL